MDLGREKGPQGIAVKLGLACMKRRPRRSNVRGKGWWRREDGKKEETYLTEVRGLDGLATLGFTSSGDLYIDASGRGADGR